MHISVLKVKITDTSELGAVEMMESFIKEEPDIVHLISIVNAHTLNLATDNPEYRDVLNSSTVVFADGTGVRWAARLRGKILQSNLVGTDLIPNFFKHTSNCGYRYYLLGADAHTITYAAEFASKQFPGWTLAGFHLNLRKGTPATVADLAVTGNCGTIEGVQYPLNSQDWLVFQHKI